MNTVLAGLRSLILLIFCLLFAGPFLWSQSLADLAKEEKERRSTIKNKVRVVSNSTLGNYQKGSVSTGVYGEGSDPDKKGKEGATDQSGEEKIPEEPVRDEKYWQTSYQTLLNEQKAAENKTVLEELNLNNLWNRFYREDDGFYRETIRKKITEKTEEIKKLKVVEEDARKVVEKLRDEARRSNVPPGWLR